MKPPRVRDVPNAAGPLAPILGELKRGLEDVGRGAAARADLVKLGLAVDRNGELTIPVSEEELSTPPAPSGVSFSIGTGNVMIEWTGMGYRGHAFTQIMRSTQDDYSTAQAVGQTSGGIYIDPVGVGSEVYYYWLRFVNKAGRVGPPHSQLGYKAQTAQSVASLIAALTEAAENPDSPYGKLALRADMIYAVDSSTGTNAGIFSIVTTPINNNGVLVPVGVYMRDLFVANGAITNAKIGNLAVDNAKIASMSVAKLVAGSLSVGEYIQSSSFISGMSGWRIHANGEAEFSGVVVRGVVFATGGEFVGTVKADAGYFRGDITGATGTFSGGVKGGAFQGYAWPPSGYGGFYIGPQGLLLGNGNDGRYFQVEANGDVYMPGFKVVNGVAEFSGKSVWLGPNGERAEISAGQFRVYQANGALRVIMGINF